MKQRILYLVYLFILMQGVSHAASEEQEIYSYWESVLQEEEPIEYIFSELRENKLKNWPMVVSPDYEYGLSDTEYKNRELFLKVSEHLLKSFKKDIVDLETYSTQDRWGYLNNLLSLREYIIASNGYINWLMQDSISRMVFIGISKSNFPDKTVRDGLFKILNKLRNYKFDLMEFIEYIKKENMGFILDVAEFDQISMPDKLTKLWKIIYPDAPFWGPRDISDIYANVMLRERRIGLLFFRYLMMSYYIDFALPITFHYFNTAADAQMNDNYGKIDEKLGAYEFDGPYGLLRERGFNRIIYLRAISSILSFSRKEGSELIKFLAIQR